MNSYSSFSDKLEEMCNRMDEDNQGECNKIRDSLMPLKVDDISNEDLLIKFKYLIARMHETQGSSCLKPVAKTAFDIMRVLFDRRDLESAAALLSFAKDTLFIYYLDKRPLYYACVNAYCTQLTGKYFDKLTQKGYKDVRNTSAGKADNGFMEIDYIYIAFSCAAFFIQNKEAASELDAEYDLARDMAKKYEEFTSFADLGYGIKEYNRKKEVQLYKDCIKKPKGFAADSPRELLRCPIWTALAYATAEASGMYYGRYNIASSMGLADVCPAATATELSLIEEMERRKKKARIIGIISVVVLIAAAFLLRSHMVTVMLILLFAAIMAAYTKMSGGKGPDVWFFGYHYFGPAYWLKR